MNEREKEKEKERGEEEGRERESTHSAFITSTLSNRLPTTANPFMRTEPL